MNILVFFDLGWKALSVIPVYNMLSVADTQLYSLS